MEAVRPSADLKMDRAAEHFEALVQETQDYFRARPFEHVQERQPDGSLGLRLKVNGHVPQHVALLFGDCLHNLRSALDHLVWSLVIANGNEPTWRNEFPIGRTGANDYRDKAPRALGGVHPRVIEVWESLEPWRGGADHGAWLYFLHTMDIADKHKLTLPVSALLVANIRVTGSDGGERTLSIGRQSFTDGQLIYDGAQGDYAGGEFTSALVVGDPDDAAAPAVLELQTVIMYLVHAAEAAINAVRPYL